jgi:predicted esterase
VSARTILIVGAYVGFAAACGGDSPGEPASSSLAGVVRNVTTGQPIADATVQVGNKTATTAADGRYELANLPGGGTITLQASAAVYDSFSETFALTVGPNTRDIGLTLKTIFASGGFTLYLTPGVNTFRGVMLYLPGNAVDSRPFLTTHRSGAGGQVQDSAEVANQFAQARGVAQRHGLALMGMAYLDFGQQASYTAILQALAAFAEQSAHSELANAPLLLHGASNGGCLAYNFARAHPDRVIGFTTMKGGCHSADAGAARSLPAYLFIGSQDTPSRQENMTELFEQNRPGGALWAVGVEPNTGHTYLAEAAILYDWSEAVLSRRLPEPGGAGSPAPLRPIVESSGWLGNRSTFAIAPYSEYVGDPATAAWLPDQAAAQYWQRLVSGQTGR